ncbi:unnamed protein product, partial [Adineta ricciae]
QGIFPDVSNRRTNGIALADSIIDEHLRVLSTSAQQQTTATSATSCEDFTNNYDGYDLFPLYDEMGAKLYDAVDSLQSTYNEKNKCTNSTISSTVTYEAHAATMNKQSYSKKKRSYCGAIHGRSTLFVSGLKNTVNKEDIRKQFPGCSDVTFKRYRKTSHLKYAFITHCTPQAAEINRQRSISVHLFGSQHRIEYAGNNALVLNSNQNGDRKKVVIEQIPPGVSDHALQSLFPGCQIIEYHPAVGIFNTTSINNSDILPGIEWDCWNWNWNRMELIGIGIRIEQNWLGLGLELESNGIGWN